LIEILDKDRIALNIFEFEGHVKADYKFITDPPILADIGTFHLDSTNLTVTMDGSNYFTDDCLQVDLKALDFNVKPFDIDLVGINDMSDVLSSLITFSGNTLASRLSSMSKFSPVQSKLNNVLNALIRLIPDEIFIDDDIYITGGINNALHSAPGKNGYISIPLDIALNSCKFPFKPNNTA